MLKTFKSSLLARKPSLSRPQLYLLSVLSILVLLNAAAVFLCIDPPGGASRELLQEQSSVGQQINLTRTRLLRLRNVSANVRVGGAQVSRFGSQYVLGERAAYSQVLEAIAHMAKSSGLQERDAVFTEEPIEGTSDLYVLNMTANYQGTYDNFMQFLYQVDLSPMLLVLDNLQASPQDKPRQIDTSIRFQSIVREDVLASGVAP